MQLDESDDSDDDMGSSSDEDDSWGAPLAGLPTDLVSSSTPPQLPRLGPYVTTRGDADEDYDNESDEADDAFETAQGRQEDEGVNQDTSEDESEDVHFRANSTNGANGDGELEDLDQSVIAFDRHDLPVIWDFHTLLRERRADMVHLVENYAAMNGLGLPRRAVMLVERASSDEDYVSPTHATGAILTDHNAVLTGSGSMWY